MNKQELIDNVASLTGGSKADAGKHLDAILDTLKGAMAKGDTVQLVGFGSFGTSQRAARNGRNPATGAEIKIAAATVPKFTAGKALKDAVNEKPAKKGKK